MRRGARKGRASGAVAHPASASSSLSIGSCVRGTAAGTPRLAHTIEESMAAHSLFHDGSVRGVFFFFQISFHLRKSYCSAHPDPELAFLSNYFSSAVTCLSRITPKREIFNTKQLLSHYSLYQREGETIEVPYSLLRALRKQDRHAAVSKPFHPPHPQPGQPGSRKFLGKMTIRKRWTDAPVSSLGMTGRRTQRAQLENAFLG